MTAQPCSRQSATRLSQRSLTKNSLPGLTLTEQLTTVTFSESLSELPARTLRLHRSYLAHQGWTSQEGLRHPPRALPQRRMDTTMKTTPQFRRTLRIGLLPALLLGLWIGHLTAAPANTPETTLRLQNHTTIVDGPAAFQHFGARWHNVTEALGDQLAEGSAPNATTRVWERCAVRVPMRGDTNRRTFIICPDGYVEHW